MNIPEGGVIKGSFGGETDNDRQALTWDKVIPDIPELKDQWLKSIKLEIVAGEIAQLSIKFCGGGEDDRKTINLHLKDLQVDFSGFITQGN